jgi:hypothetical protein
VKGALRIADWMADPTRPAEPAHAYLALGPIPFRGLCDSGRWTVRSVRVEAGPLCPVCREIVRGCANRTLDEVVDLEGAAAFAAVERLAAADVPEGEARAMWGNR